MGKLGFALGTLAGMAINMANARQRRAYELNEHGIYLCNNFRYNEALDYFLEASSLLPDNMDIKNNISICREALNESRRQLRKSQNASRDYNYIQSTSHNIKPTMSDSIKYYPTLQDIPETLIILFFKEKQFNFNSKLDLINHADEYWSNKDIENFIKEVEFFEDSTPDLSAKIEEFELQKLKQDDYNKYLERKHQLEQQRLEEEQRRLEEERENLYHRIQYSKIDFQNFIIDNMEDLCRIYSIPKLGKTYVVNHICDNYSALEVWNALEMYKK